MVAAPSWWRLGSQRSFLKPEHTEYPENVFVCGDAKSGASLVVRAIASGLKTADDVDKYLSKDE